MTHENGFRWYIDQYMNDTFDDCVIKTMHNIIRQYLNAVKLI